MATDSGRFQRGPEKTWEKSVPSQIILNSIFAALSAVLITIVIGDSLPPDLKYWQNKCKFAELLLALFSFFLFAMSAEGTTNAYEEKDVRKYVYYLLSYNLGVIFIGFAIAILVGVHFVEHLGNILTWTSLGALSQRAAEISAILALFVIDIFVLQWNWLCDAWWLCRSSDADFRGYLQELEDEVEPRAAPTRLMKLFYKRRNLPNNLPHEGVWTRLKPSKIHGIGVFAIRDIPRGTSVFHDDDEPIIWVDKTLVERLPTPFKEFYDDFCISKGKKYGCPTYFDALTPSWYLNHSESPNVAADKNYRFHALRAIQAGEELTANYLSYSDGPPVP